MTRPPWREIIFGLTDGERYSPHWTVRSAPTRPELVFANSQAGDRFHLTMHEDPNHWHVKWRHEDGQESTVPWEPPMEMRPGIRRLLRFMVHVESVRFPRPAGGSRVKWGKPAPEDQWAEFTVVHYITALALFSDAHPVDFVPLADGTSAFVYRRNIPMYPITIPAEAAPAMRTSPGPRTALIVVKDGDGALGIVQAFSTKRDVRG